MDSMTGSCLIQSTRPYSRNFLVSSRTSGILVGRASTGRPDLGAALHLPHGEVDIDGIVDDIGQVEDLDLLGDAGRRKVLVVPAGSARVSGTGLPHMVINPVNGAATSRPLPYRSNSMLETMDELLNMSPYLSDARTCSRE